jgi:hypothetical protein
LDVAYEDLVTSPSTAGFRIFRFLGLETESASLGEANTASIGRWRARLDREQLRDTLEAAGPLLQRLDYGH